MKQASTLYKCLFVCLFLATTANAQTFQDFFDPTFTNQDIFRNKSATVQGITYFQQEWSRGTISDSKDARHELQLCYHNLEDNLYAKTNDNKISLVNKRMVSRFSLLIGSKQYIFAKVETDTKEIYAELAYAGKTKLYKQYKKAIERKGGYNELPVETYVDKEVLYIQAGQKAIEFKMNKKFMLATFPDKAAAIEGFWKKEKNKFKTENDLINTLKFLDSVAN